MPGCVSLSSTPFTLHETPILHCLEVLRPNTYSNPAISLLHYRPVWCICAPSFLRCCWQLEGFPSRVLSCCSVWAIWHVEDGIVWAEFKNHHSLPYHGLLGWCCLQHPARLILVTSSCWEEQTVWLRRSKRKLVGAAVRCIREGCHRRSPAVGPGVRPPLQKRTAENGRSVLG